MKTRKAKSKTKTKKAITTEAATNTPLKCGCCTWKEGGDWMLHACKAHEALYFTDARICSMQRLKKEIDKLCVSEILTRMYGKLVTQAKRFVREVEGDFSFTKPEVNFLCVEHMLMGWIYAQPWFPHAVKATLALYKRENIALSVDDMALQATTDATAGIKRFKY